MKYLVVIALVLLLLYWIYRKLRPYLRSVQGFINTLREIQQSAVVRPRKQERGAEKLVRCETCGTWVPAGRALSAGTGDMVFCSQECFKGRKVGRRAS